MKGAAIDINLHFHVAKVVIELPQSTAQLDRIEAAFTAVATKLETIMADLTALTAAVTKSTDAEQSAITLLQGLSAQISALKTDPVALQTLADQLNSKADDLAAAVVANTPTA